MAEYIIDHLVQRIADGALPMISVARGMMMSIPKAELEGANHEDIARRKERIVKNIREASQIQLVVAALLMTVTFTAGFTLPGGFESNSSNKGMAVLLKKAAFRAFIISDVIGFSCSSAAVFAYFSMATRSISSVTELKVTPIIQLYNMAILWQFLGMTAVQVAFATGLYATLAHSLGLAIAVCVICGFSFYSVCFMILFPEN